MSNLINLNAKSLTPQQVLEKCLEVDDVTHAYVVLVHGDGEISVRASGDLSRIADASLYLNHYATKAVRGEIEGE